MNTNEYYFNEFLIHFCKVNLYDFLSVKKPLT